MKIQSKRLTMVPLGPKFLLSTHTYSSDLGNTKYMVHLPNIDINETKDFLDNVQEEWKKCDPQFYEFAILLESEHIGAVSIYMNDDYTEGELGWIINKAYWGNGYASEAANALISFAEHELKVKKFIAHCDSENVGSYRVMEKLGMSLVNRTWSRRNKSSDMEREKLMYSMELKE